MKGAMVFPGGVCERESDAIANWPALASTATLSDKVCAIRELFEESGLLLARHADSKASARFSDCVVINDSVQRRKMVHDDATKFKSLCSGVLERVGLLYKNPSIKCNIYS